MYDALQAHSAAVSPHETREARAIRFEKAHKSAIKKAHDLTTTAAALLDTFANEANAAAHHKAGLSLIPRSAQEIRAALRQMTPEARERVIADAFARGDNEVLASIHRARHPNWAARAQRNPDIGAAVLVAAM
ncbi:MAG: hypothetical protein JXR75_04235 [Rhodobacteraceae bacterium]|nr:hypothetical protein [Paracoccaceae bacterium]